MTTKRITDVDFLEKLDSNESFFVNKNNSIRQINKSNVVFDIVNGGTGATDAATARVNLGAASVDSVNEVASSLTDLNNSFNEYAKNNNAFVVDLSNTLDECVMRNEVITMSNGGTGSNNGADGLKNLFAAGVTILSFNQYGDELPPAGIAGRVFLKKVPLSESGEVV